MPLVLKLLLEQPEVDVEDEEPDIGSSTSEDCLRFFRGGGETPPNSVSCQEARVSRYGLPVGQGSKWTPWLSNNSTHYCEEKDLK